MNVNKLITGLITDILAEVEILQEDMNGVDQKHQERENKLFGKYSADLLRDKLEEEKQNHHQELTEVKEAFRNRVLPKVEETQRKYDLYVRMSHTDDIEILNRLSLLPLDQADFDLLSGRYGGKSYWNDLCLLNMAYANKICPCNVNLPLSAFNNLLEDIKDIVETGEVEQITTELNEIRNGYTE